MEKVFRSVAAILALAASLLFAAVGSAEENPQQAIQKYTAEIQRNPNNIETYCKRGIAYYDLKQYERAIQDFSKAIELKPNYAFAYYSRCHAYLKLGDKEKARADYVKAKALGW